MLIETEIPVLDELQHRLDIPASYYEKSVERYKAIGEWLCREASTVRDFAPDIYSHGSFRLGTVIHPLSREGAYDLDLVCCINLNTGEVSQKDLKQLIGREIELYAERFSISAPVDESPRCWRLDYADELSFHMDILPCVPRPTDVRAQAQEGAYSGSVLITDNRLSNYAQLSPQWLTANPLGIGSWFESRCITTHLFEAKMAQKSIAEVPAYTWKTPLQKAIQVLKRHRDRTFRDNPEFAPSSMIITVLAALAYKGTVTLTDSLNDILSDFTAGLTSRGCRLPNPTNQEEDFAEKWKLRPALETNFFSWLAQARSDIMNLATVQRFSESVSLAKKAFDVDLAGRQQLRPSSELPATGPTVIVSPPKPWERK
ncbi:MAG: nucleotidyltransferase [Candidatus Eremiobacteraeota bacterium]|nr:nucleotidyltransferase [Candidatus Eremiobacteraeota bacterium]MCW5870129.1 nucleotidyltransferase [Candidatus Eremiobacteraeota bacterium]